MLHLYDPTPDEGTIEVNSIIELMKALCFSPLEQSSITTESNITQTPLYQLLHGITTGNNDEKNPFKLYILEHDGHFILLDLKQTENGVEYGIYDSISYKPPKGKIREVRIKKILENIFHGQTVTHNQNQYIRIRQGTNHAIIDADNCGLTSLFAQFIFEQFGEDFPIDIFINNPSLYSRLNAIAQNMRGRQDINIDQVAQELTLLALEITENHLEQQQEDPSETFNLDQELEYMTQILTQCPHGQEEGLPYQLIAEFQEILKKSLINKGQINQQNIEAIKTLHDSFVMLYMHYRDEFLSSTQENAIKTIAGDSSAHSELDKEIQF